MWGSDFAYIIGNKDTDTGIYPPSWNDHKFAHTYEGKTALKQDVISTQGKKYKGVVNYCKQQLHECYSRTLDLWKHLCSWLVTAPYEA